MNIPLVITSSAMCIINSISTDANTVKIPNIVVNAISVLIMSMVNSVKPAEKFDLFKRLSQQFMELSQEIDAIEEEDIPIEKYNVLLLKYENLLKDCAFEEIPASYKSSVSQVYQNSGRYIPIQLNGTIGNLNRRNSKNIEMVSEIV